MNPVLLLRVVGAMKLAAASDAYSPFAHTKQQALNKHNTLDDVIDAYVVLLARNIAFAIA